MTSEYDVKSFLTLIVALGVCLLAGYIGAYPVLSGTPLGLPVDLPPQTNTAITVTYTGSQV